jgi:hypothetical protein
MQEEGQVREECEFLVQASDFICAMPLKECALKLMISV